MGFFGSAVIKRALGKGRKIGELQIYGLIRDAPVPKFPELRFAPFWWTASPLKFVEIIHVVVAIASVLPLPLQLNRHQSHGNVQDVEWCDHSASCSRLGCLQSLTLCLERRRIIRKGVAHCQRARQKRRRFSRTTGGRTSRADVSGRVGPGEAGITGEWVTITEDPVGGLAGNLRDKRQRA